MFLFHSNKAIPDNTLRYLAIPINTYQFQTMPKNLALVGMDNTLSIVAITIPGSS
jgi:hypothetical protein